MQRLTARNLGFFYTATWLFSCGFVRWGWIFEVDVGLWILLSRLKEEMCLKRFVCLILMCQVLTLENIQPSRDLVYTLYSVHVYAWDCVGVRSCWHWLMRDCACACKWRCVYWKLLSQFQGRDCLIRFNNIDIDRSLSGHISRVSWMSSKMLTSSWSPVQYLTIISYALSGPVDCIQNVCFFEWIHLNKTRLS